MKKSILLLGASLLIGCFSFAQEKTEAPAIQKKNAQLKTEKVEGAKMEKAEMKPMRVQKMERANVQSKEADFKRKEATEESNSPKTLKKD